MKWLGVRVLSFFTGIFLFLLMVEGFFVLVYYLHDGSYIPAEQKIMIKAPKEYRVIAEPGCAGRKDLSPHPFLGFSRLAKPHCDNFDFQAGHTGEPFPDKKQPEKFTVLVTGGSVPAQLMHSANPSLGELLSKNYRYQGREILVLHGAVEAWRQPQQTIMLMLNAHLIDAVVTLEGFNELMFSRSTDYRYDFLSPDFSVYQKANVSLFSDRMIGLMWIAEKSFLWVLEGNVLKHSKTVLFILEQMRRTVKYETRNVNGYDFFLRQASAFSIENAGAESERKQWFFERYRQQLRSMQGIADAHGIRFAFFLQPVPSIGKQLTDHEKSNRAFFRYDDSYLRLESALLALRHDKIDVNSLTQVFADFTGTAYSDGIHLDLSGDAPYLLNKAIIEVLVQHWGLERVEAQ